MTGTGAAQPGATNRGGVPTRTVPGNTTYPTAGTTHPGTPTTGATRRDSKAVPGTHPEQDKGRHPNAPPTSVEKVGKPGNHGNEVHPAAIGLPKEPKRDVRQIGNRTVSTDVQHRVRDIHSPDMNIHRGLSGERRIERTLPGGRRIVVAGGSHGFYERPYLNRGGHSYIQRTYVVEGRPYAVVYRTYYYGGVAYYRYVPAYYYQPRFYGWAFSPWQAPVYYNWGWAPTPWYGYYGYYFTPAPAYPSAALWLTDFLLAQSLQQAYESRQQDSREPGDSFQASAGENRGTALSPEVKQAISEEVKQQLEAEQQAAQSSSHLSNDSDVPPALDPKLRIFVVSSNLDVVGDKGQECVLTPGDIVLRTGNELVDGKKVEVSVQSSKKGDCTPGANTQLEVAELQEMHNHFREHIDAGLKQLAANQGKGLPTAPDTTMVASEVPPAAPDTNADSEIQNQRKQADQTEQEVVRQTSSGVPAEVNDKRRVPSRSMSVRA